MEIGRRATSYYLTRGGYTFGCSLEQAEAFVERMKTTDDRGQRGIIYQEVRDAYP